MLKLLIKIFWTLIIIYFTMQLLFALGIVITRYIELFVTFYPSWILYMFFSTFLLATIIKFAVHKMGIKTDIRSYGMYLLMSFAFLGFPLVLFVLAPETSNEGLFSNRIEKLLPILKNMPLPLVSVLFVSSAVIDIRAYLKRGEK